MAANKIKSCPSQAVVSFYGQKTFEPKEFSANKGKIERICSQKVRKCVHLPSGNWTKFEPTSCGNFLWIPIVFLISRKYAKDSTPARLLLDTSLYVLHYLFYFSLAKDEIPEKRGGYCYISQ